MNYLKQSKIIDRKYLDSAKDRCCLCCGSRGTTVGHHLRSSNSAGTGVKAPDNHVVFLCYRHHNDIHDNEKQFFNKWQFVFGDSPIAFAEMLYKRWLDSRE